VALGFAVARVAGQNFGAHLESRVRETFRSAVGIAIAVMVLFALLCHIAPAAMIRIFSSDPQVIAVGEEYLRIVSWNFIASGVVFVSSSMFQAIGNTIPSLLSSLVRVIGVALPAVIMSKLPGFQLNWIWYLTVAAIALQMVLSLTLLQRELKLRLGAKGPLPSNTTVLPPEESVPEPAAATE
jgi:Na+-driven multidrug efflux pump